jgi:hypothetical protein
MFLSNLLKEDTGSLRLAVIKNQSSVMKTVKIAVMEKLCLYTWEILRTKPIILGL